MPARKTSAKQTTKKQLKAEEVTRKKIAAEKAKELKSKNKAEQLKLKLQKELDKMNETQNKLNDLLHGSETGGSKGKDAVARKRSSSEEEGEEDVSASKKVKVNTANGGCTEEESAADKKGAAASETAGVQGKDVSGSKKVKTNGGCTEEESAADKKGVGAAAAAAETGVQGKRSNEEIQMLRVQKRLVYLITCDPVAQHSTDPNQKTMLPSDWLFHTDQLLERMLSNPKYDETNKTVSPSLIMLCVVGDWACKGEVDECAAKGVKKLENEVKTVTLKKVREHLSWHKFVAGFGYSLLMTRSGMEAGQLYPLGYAVRAFKELVRFFRLLICEFTVPSETAEERADIEAGTDLKKYFYKFDDAVEDFLGNKADFEKVQDRFFLKYGDARDKFEANPRRVLTSLALRRSVPCENTLSLGADSINSIIDLMWKTTSRTRGPLDANDRKKFETTCRSIDRKLVLPFTADKVDVKDSLFLDCLNIERYTDAVAAAACLPKEEEKRHQADDLLDMPTVCLSPENMIELQKDLESSELDTAINVIRDEMDRSDAESSASAALLESISNEAQVANGHIANGLSDDDSAFAAAKNEDKRGGAVSGMEISSDSESESEGDRQCPPPRSPPPPKVEKEKDGEVSSSSSPSSRSSSSGSDNDNPPNCGKSKKKVKKSRSARNSAHENSSSSSSCYSSDEEEEQQRRPNVKTTVRKNKTPVKPVSTRIPLAEDSEYNISDDSDESQQVKSSPQQSQQVKSSPRRQQSDAVPTYVPTPIVSVPTPMADVNELVGKMKESLQFNFDEVRDIASRCRTDVIDCTQRVVSLQNTAEFASGTENKQIQNLHDLVASQTGRVLTDTAAVASAIDAFKMSFFSEMKNISKLVTEKRSAAAAMMPPPASPGKKSSPAKSACSSVVEGGVLMTNGQFDKYLNKCLGILCGDFAANSKDSGAELPLPDRYTDESSPASALYNRIMDVTDDEEIKSHLRVLTVKDLRALLLFLPHYKSGTFLKPDAYYKGMADADSDYDPVLERSRDVCLSHRIPEHIVKIANVLTHALKNEPGNMTVVEVVIARFLDMLNQLVGNDKKVAHIAQYKKRKSDNEVLQQTMGVGSVCGICEKAKVNYGYMEQRDKRQVFSVKFCSSCVNGPNRPLVRNAIAPMKVKNLIPVSYSAKNLTIGHSRKLVSTQKKSSASSVEDLKGDEALAYCAKDLIAQTPSYE